MLEKNIIKSSCLLTLKTKERRCGLDWENEWDLWNCKGVWGKRAQADVLAYLFPLISSGGASLPLYSYLKCYKLKELLPVLHMRPMVPLALGVLFAWDRLPSNTSQLTLPTFTNQLMHHFLQEASGPEATPPFSKPLIQIAISCYDLSFLLPQGRGPQPQDRGPVPGPWPIRNQAVHLHWQPLPIVSITASAPPQIFRH